MMRIENTNSFKSRAKAMLLLIGTVLLFVLESADAFSAARPLHRHITTASLLQLDASRSASSNAPTTTRRRKTKKTVVAVPVQPKTSISPTKRKRAKLAMEKQRQVDAQMLQLLSDQFLYPEPQPNRPRGRPAMVPGAMNYQTVIQYRKNQEDAAQRALQAAAGKPSLSTTVPYTSSAAGLDQEWNTVLDNKEEKETKPTPKQAESTVVVKRGRGRPRKDSKDDSVASTIKPAAKTTTSRIKSTKGSKKQQAKTTMGLSTTKEHQPKKKRKRVVKNLPKPRSKQSKRPAMPKGDPLNLQRYYLTELLTPSEEYSLGMKVQFMMHCELVHEGLSAKLERLPTIVEWAAACGFDTPDPDFIAKEGDEQIRPAGSDTKFEQVNPNNFVGNGLANNVGVGRGRGRVKEPPPLELGDFYDDSALRFVEKNGKMVRNTSVPKSKLEPINRGTALDFVEKMMDSKAAKQRMVQCNMRLVVSIARKYSKVGVNLQDLVQEGSLGLTRAAEKFEPAKGFKFSTYASWWIQQAVFRSIAYHSRTIRLPVHVHNLLNRVRRIKMSLEQDFGRTPTNEEIAEQLDMTVQKYNKMLSLTRRSISLEVPKYQHNPKDFGHQGEDLLGETIDANAAMLDENDPEKKVDRGLLRADLREMLKILEEDERRVISARYGLDDGLTRTVTSVAAQLKQSKSWVRSQECRALRKLRRPWYETRLKEHQNSLTG